MSHDVQFTTTVSHHTKDGVELRGRSLSSLINQADFVSTFFLSLTGRAPTEPERVIFNAILTACIDHGIEPASGFVPRVIAASGNEVKTAMAGTILSIGEYHGGAITKAMETLQSIHSQRPSIEKACVSLVTTTKERHERIMGFGHAIYKDADPRAEELLKLAMKHGLSPDYISIARTLEQTLEQITRKKLVLNVDGAIAALLLTMEFDPLAGTAIFALARTAGSIAHIIEELRQNQPVRRLPEGSVT
jgi:citrate synthase